MLGNYRVLDRLGSVSIGVIFKAEHLPSRRHIAIKVLLPAREKDPQSLGRCFVERQTLAQLQHPNIVSALDFGESSTPDPDAPRLHY